MGWAPSVVTAVPHRRRRVARSSLGLVVLLIMVGLIAGQGWFLVEIPLGDSEWAFDNTGLRDLSDEGLDGEGVRLCVVDTGFDASHSAFEGQEVMFRDFVGNSVEPLDRGATAHGTMMVGLLVADGHQQGAAKDRSGSRQPSLATATEKTPVTTPSLQKPSTGAALVLMLTSFRFRWAVSAWKGNVTWWSPRFDGHWTRAFLSSQQRATTAVQATMGRWPRPPSCRGSSLWAPPTKPALCGRIPRVATGRASIHIGSLRSRRLASTSSQRG